MCIGCLDWFRSNSKHKGSSVTNVSDLEDQDLINAVDIFLGPDQVAIIILYLCFLECVRYRDL